MRKPNSNPAIEAVVTKMADSLLAAANDAQVDIDRLKILRTSNFNTLLDDLFCDGGETRCERFCDLAWPYARLFGPLESDGFEKAQWECIEAAIEEVRDRVSGA